MKMRFGRRSIDFGSVTNLYCERKLLTQLRRPAISKTSCAISSRWSGRRHELHEGSTRITRLFRRHQLHELSRRLRRLGAIGASDKIRLDRREFRHFASEFV